MERLLGQLGLDQTFFLELALIAGLFFVLSSLYFKPFLALFEARHKKTVLDKEAAEKLAMDAQLRLKEYKQIVATARDSAKKEIEDVLVAARAQEAALLSAAREEARVITQKAADSISQQRNQLRRDLEFDVESLAQNISERLLSRKV